MGREADVAINKLKTSDLQFRAKGEEKLRRLNEELALARRTINQVIDVLASAESSGALGEHVLATVEGLGESHTVSDLSPGMILTAISDVEAAFRFFTLDDLSDVDVDGALDGDLLRRSGGSWVAASVPGLNLTDPGSDFIVFWNESIDDLDFLTLGTGLVISGGMLVLDASALDHGGLAGLTDDDHPQYPLHAFAETISGDWTFTGLPAFERNGVDLTFTHTGAAADEQDWHLAIDDDGFSLHLANLDSDGDQLFSATRTANFLDTLAIAELISITRADGIGVSIDYGTIEEEVQHTLYGSLLVDGDEPSLAIGALVSLHYDEDENSTTLTTTGDFYWDTALAPDVGASLYLDFEVLDVRGSAPSIIVRSEEAIDNEGAWSWLASAAGMMQLAILNSDGSIGEAWASVIAEDGVIVDINLSGDAFSFNGLRVLTEDDLGSVSGGSLGTDVQADTIAAGSQTVALDSTDVGFLDLTPNAGDTTLTNITGASDGQLVIVSNLDAANSLTIQANADIRMSSDLTLLENQSIGLRYSDDLGVWVAFA
jgi:hypothetical protein